MNGIDSLALQLQKTINEKDKNKKTGYDTQATVVKVEDDTIWVKIPGGVDETPVAKTTSAKPGDTVQVRVSGGRAWVVGNYTSPPTDDARANAAYILADDANENANIAKSAAESAIQDAGIARQAAESASADALSAHEAAEQAQEEATLVNEAASSAQNSANSAKDSATTAINQLSIVENVVGVLDLLQRNGKYELTQDIEVRDDKWYFTRSESEPYSYTVVPNPEGDPSEQGLYELVGIDESVRNYVSSHLALTDEGLWLQTDGMATKVLLSSTDGVVIYGPTGSVIGKYGNTAQIGDLAGFHIEMNGTELGFYQVDRKVAYISNNQLYISQSVVLQRMDLGIPVASGGLGQWSWKVHPNGQTPSRNNLNLKWIG